MSNNIPFEIQEEIIKKLPVKSLIQFRSVSKQWKSLIDSSEFITDHSLNQNQPHHLLITYKVASEDKYVSIADDDGFPHHTSFLFVPPIVKMLASPSMIDCSHGLVCLRGYTQDQVDIKYLVFWNPSVRKSVAIPIPCGFEVVGVGVCPKTSDPKIVAITTFNRPRGNDSKAEVYTLSSGAWRSISMNLRRPLESAILSNKPVVIDGVIHWIAFDDLPLRIITFDLTSEEFGDVELPDSLAHSTNLSIFNFKGSLAVVIYNKAALVCDVWTMIKTGDPKFWFTKPFTVSFERKSDRITGFRQNGQMITEHASMRTSYTESLLLLNHSTDSVTL